MGLLCRPGLLNDATPIFLPTNEENGYAIDPAELEQRITPRTKAMIINSPCNPNGRNLWIERCSNTSLRIAVRHRSLLISDEIYEKILYDGATHTSIASLGPEIAARTVVINGVSKAYAMTGWRVGYAAGPKDLHHRHGEHSKPEYVQSLFDFTEGGGRRAAIRRGVYETDGDAEFDRRRRTIVEGLNEIPGVSCSDAGGAFYAFPNIRGVLGSKVRPARSIPRRISRLISQDAQIAVVPGEPFGSQRHIRLSYATSMDTITNGLKRLRGALEQLK